MRNDSISQIYRASRYAQNIFIHFLIYRLKNIKKRKKSNSHFFVLQHFTPSQKKTNITVRFPSYFFATTFYHRK